MKTPRVPDKITSPVRRLCNTLVPGGRPIFVKVYPDENADPNDCFVTVENKIRTAGGRAQYGWAIWYLPGILMEAEFHSVWVSLEGDYTDVSRRALNFKEIMFLPDPRRVYSGKQVDNVRIPLSKDPRVKEFIRLHEAKFRVLNEGDLATQHGAVSVPREKIRPIMERLMQLTAELNKD